MLDDGVIYEGRKVNGRSRNLRLIPKSGSLELRRAALFEGTSRTKGMQRDSREPEVAHPGSGDSKRYQSSMITSETGARASALRSSGKQTFLSVLKETVEFVALEAASQAIDEETDKMEDLRLAQMMRSNSAGMPRRRSSTTSSTSGWAIDPPLAATTARPPSLPRGDSAPGSTFRERSCSPMRHDFGSNDHAQSQSSERRRRRGQGRNSPMAQAEGLAVVAAAAVPDSMGSGEGGRRPGSLSFRSTADAMEDEERETLLSLLTGAYSQVNELTDELQIALQKLQETEKKLEDVMNSDKNSEAPRDEEARTAGTEEVVEVARPTSKTKAGGGVFLKGFFPVDEGARSTPATVRQLQVEVQRLRQRVMRANSKEEKYRADNARNQRLMAVMESQMAGGDLESTSPTAPSAGPAPRKKRSNGSCSKSSDAKPLVDRVAELEEKLVNCSMENATAKQDHLAAKLRASQLEKNAEMVRHELAKSRAMNNLLQNEIDRLQGTFPEDEADGKGWRRWLGGVQEPLSPEPHPIRVHGIEDSDSPVVVVRDLDNNQLVYAPGRSEFF